MTTEKAVRGLVKSYQQQMGLERWHFIVAFGPIRDDKTGEVGTISGACVAHPRYMDAELYFDLKRMEEKCERAEQLVRHEMLHVFSWWLAELAGMWAGDDPTKQRLVEDREELCTSMLERMAVWD